MADHRPLRILGFEDRVFAPLHPHARSNYMLTFLHLICCLGLGGSPLPSVWDFLASSINNTIHSRSSKYLNAVHIKMFNHIPGSVIK